MTRKRNVILGGVAMIAAAGLGTGGRRRGQRLACPARRIAGRRGIRGRRGQPRLLHAGLLLVPGSPPGWKSSAGASA
jgi:hypothetical protein